MKSGGSVIIAITANITGISRMNDAFIPKSVDESGTVNGQIVIATPDTRTKLKS